MNNHNSLVIPMVFVLLTIVGVMKIYILILLLVMLLIDICNKIIILSL